MRMIQLYHVRACKRFEQWARKKGYTFTFEGFGYGYYDPYYQIQADADFATCPVPVWDEAQNRLNSSPKP